MSGKISKSFSLYLQQKFHFELCLQLISKKIILDIYKQTARLHEAVQAIGQSHLSDH